MAAVEGDNDQLNVSVCTTQKLTLFSERGLRSMSGFRPRIDSIGHKPGRLCPIVQTLSWTSNAHRNTAICRYFASG
jgi:hypothetical protein